MRMTAMRLFGVLLLVVLSVHAEAAVLQSKARALLAQADARELVQNFGELGRRRFHLAA